MSLLNQNKGKGKKGKKDKPLSQGNSKFIQKPAAKSRIRLGEHEVLSLAFRVSRSSIRVLLINPGQATSQPASGCYESRDSNQNYLFRVVAAPN